MPSPFPVPDACPACSGPLKELGDFLYCRAKSCPARLASALKVWISRLGLLHWGDALIDALSDPDNPRVSSVADLYRLTEEELAECCSGRKMAAKCLQTLHSAKSVPMEVLLAGLNIPGLGVATASDIVGAGFDTLPKMAAITYDDLMRVPNIGDLTAKQIMEGLLERRAVLADLATVIAVASRAQGPLSGRSFCITGATSVPRKALQKDILAAGGMVKESVVAGLSFLVTNQGDDYGSSKMKKAQKLGVSVITESELISMMRPGVGSAGPDSPGPPDPA